MVVARRIRRRQSLDVDVGGGGGSKNRPHLVVRASGGEGSGSSSSESDGEGSSSNSRIGSESLEEKEARLAALERGVKRKGGAAARSLASQANASRAANSPSRPSAGPANWPEGQLLPDGWDDMSLFQRAAELYQGRRGFLFWASQAAWYSAIGVGFGWVLFRFVLPGIGLYKLANGLTDAPTPL